MDRNCEWCRRRQATELWQVLDGFMWVCPTCIRMTTKAIPKRKVRNRPKPKFGLDQLYFNFNFPNEKGPEALQKQPGPKGI